MEEHEDTQPQVESQEERPRPAHFFAHPPRRDPNVPSFSVHIKNIPSDVAEQEMFERFSQFGTIIDVYLPKDVRTRARKGFGFVEFSQLDEAEAAVEALNGVALKEGLDQPLLFCELAKHQRKTKQDMIQSSSRGGGGGGRGFRSPPPPRRLPPPRRTRRSSSPPPPRTERRRSRPPPRRRDRSPRH